MKQSLILIAASALGYASALCPGLEVPCSGHGSCGTNDICTCYPNWDQVDCSERKCPYKKAWSDIKDTTISGRDVHYYAECSGRGECDSMTGECICLEGFTGAGCDRMTCPEDCSGHGTCEKLEDVNSGYTGWDADKIQVCQCDPGWEGIACNKRKCPLGDDPITSYTSAGVTKVSQVQQIAFTADAPGPCTGNFAIRFTDMYGASWDTHRIDVATISTIAVTQALQALPNAAVPSVSVSTGGDVDTNCDLTIDITFSDAANTGNLPEVSVVDTVCTTAGCQPVIDGISCSGGCSSVTTAASITTPGTKDRAVCSNRGKCNSETGQCQCADGYMGDACDSQTIFT